MKMLSNKEKDKGQDRLTSYKKWYGIVKAG